MDEPETVRIPQPPSGPEDPQSPDGLIEPVSDDGAAGPARREDAQRRPPAEHRRLRRRRALAGAVVLLVAAAITVLTVPVPFVEGYLAGTITDQITAQMSCPGSSTPAPRVTLRGGRLVPQLLSRRLTEIQLVMPDLTMGGVRHASLQATLRGVRQAGSGARVDRMDASITVPFAGMPAPATGPRPTLARTPDGLLSVRVVPAPGQGKDVVTTVFLRFDLRGDTLTVTPARLLLFGHSVPGSKFAKLSGGPHVQQLPHLPAGLNYTAIRPESDGLHVRLDGAVTTPLSALPTSFAGHTVSYSSERGLLGFTTSVGLPLLPSIQLTIFAAPQLSGNTLTMQPQFVRIFGADRGPDDPIAALVLSQIKASDLSRRLPALPTGIAYRSVRVSGAGITVVVGGESVRPFSQLPLAGAGPGATFGAQDGFLTVTSKGAFSHGPSVPIVLVGKPRIVGGALDLSPRTIQMLDTVFPATDVLKEFKVQSTSFPLQALPAHLSYTGVDVLATGLRLTISGRDVLMTKGSLAGQGCPGAAAGAGRAGARTGAGRPGT